MALSVNTTNVRIQRNILIVTSICLALACFATALSNSLNFSPSKQFVILAEVLFMFVFTVCAYKAYKGSHNQWHKYAVVYGYAFLIILAYSQLKPGNSVIQWWYSIPVMAFMLLDKRHSLVFCSAMLLIGASIFAYNNVFILHKLWHPGLINLVFPYVIIMLIANAYERVRMHNEYSLTQLALTDTLTGLLNREALARDFAAKKLTNEAFCLAVIDVDHFKAINDTYGHDVGDFALVELSKQFQSHLGNDEVYRLGGEEFVCLIKGSLDTSFAKIECLREAIADQKFQFENAELNIRFSAGLVDCMHNATLSEALKNADMLLYQAKDQGRNLVLSA